MHETRVTSVSRMWAHCTHGSKGARETGRAAAPGPACLGRHNRGASARQGTTAQLQLSLHDVPRAVELRHGRRGQLVADARTGRLLGLHAAAESAGQMLAATYAMTTRWQSTDLADASALYLTKAGSLRLAAGPFCSSLLTSCCA